MITVTRNEDSRDGKRNAEDDLMRNVNAQRHTNVREYHQPQLCIYNHITSKQEAGVKIRKASDLLYD